MDQDQLASDVCVTFFLNSIFSVENSVDQDQLASDMCVTFSKFYILCGKHSGSRSAGF